MNQKNHTQLAWLQIIDKIDSFSELQDDYDGNGSVPPSDTAIRAAMRLAMQMSAAGDDPPLRAVAGPNGDISLEYMKSIIEIDHEGYVSADFRQLPTDKY